MANYRKSFNFRNGVQVDDDNLVVNSVGNVGIGTTIPTELLDVRGTTRVVGLITANNAYVSGVSTFANVAIGTAITIDSSSGIITATQFFGDGATLSNLPTSQWIDVDVGLGFTSIYSAGNVGVGTTDPRNSFQIGGDPYNSGKGVGISSATGNIKTSGIVSATSFIGFGSGLTLLNASNISSGTIAAARVPQLNNSSMPDNISVSGIVTATGGFVGAVTGNVTGDVTGNVTGNLTGNVVGVVTGNVTGTATTATSLSGTPDITVGTVTAAKLIANVVEVPSTGITTISQLLHVGTGGTGFSATSSGKVGIGTATTTSELQIRKTDDVLAEIISDTGQSQVSIGQSVGVGNSTAVLRFGNSANTFDVINRDTGNLNMILHGGGSGIGTGRFDWIYGQTNAELMSLTYDGKLGIGKTNPDTNLHVVGTSTVTSNAWFGSNVTITGTLSAGTISLPDLISANISNTSGISTFFDVNIINDLLVDADIGIGTDNASPIVNFDARGRSGLIGNLGINTTIQATASLEVVGQALFDSVGIGTTTTQGEGLYANGVSIVQHDATTTLYDSVLYIRDNGAIGVGTTAVRCQVDFGDAGKTAAEINPGEGTGSRAYMLPPRLTNAQRVGLVTETGAMIYNLDTNKFQGFDGTAWRDFH